MVFQILNIRQERQWTERELCERELGEKKKKAPADCLQVPVCGPGRGTQADGDRLLELRWFLESGKDKLAGVCRVGYWRGKSCSENLRDLQWVAL